MAFSWEDAVKGALGGMMGGPGGAVAGFLGGGFGESLGEAVSDVADIATGKSSVEAAKGVTEAAMPYLEEGLGRMKTSGQEAVAGFSPYSGAGEAALQQQQALAGLLGPEAQAAAIAQLEASPQFQSMVAQGERAILQNAAATGGVRGGNVQAALATFRPQLLSQIIEQQYAKLGGLSSQGLEATGRGAQVGLGYAGLEAPFYGELASTAAFPAAAEMQRQQQLTSTVQGIGTGLLGLGAKVGQAAVLSGMGVPTV